jgi:hypothetical protein
MRLHLDRPVFPSVNGDIELDLSDTEADGRACIRCGRVDGPMVPVGWADRPTAVLRRLGVSDDARRCQVFAHDECVPRNRVPA